MWLFICSALFDVYCQRVKGAFYAPPDRFVECTLHISISIKLCPPVLFHGTSNQYACSTDRPSMERDAASQGCCMELGNWPIMVQLGSTNSKGLPVLFQGSHQGFFLNNQSIHYDGSNGHAHCHPLHVHKPNKKHLSIHTMPGNSTPTTGLDRNQLPCVHPSHQLCHLACYLFHPDTYLTTDTLAPSTDRRVGCHLEHHHVVPNQLKGVDIWRGSTMSAKQSNSGAHTPMSDPPCTAQGTLYGRW